MRLILPILLLLLQISQSAGPVFAYSDVPPSSLKIPAMVPEKSFSTFIPSKAAPERGLAVNIIYPAKPRYPEGAPVCVVVPDGNAPDELEFSMHAAQAGFLEIRFAFPGGGRTGFASGGYYDNRGPRSQLALKDVLDFAVGNKPDFQGRTITHLLPLKVATNNVGIVGWGNGGNTALVTLGKYAAELGYIKWIAFYESPVGSLFIPPNLGGIKDFILNKHYREGSCATGNCLIDFRKLTFLPSVQKEPGAHKRIGEPEIKGIVFFDENKNKHWDEAFEYALSYACLPGIQKQIYPPIVLHAFLRMKTFETEITVTVPEEERDEKTTDKKVEKKEEEKKAESKPGGLFGKKEDKDTEKKKDAEKKKVEPTKTVAQVNWPDELATVEEATIYYQERDGSQYITDIAEKLPQLMAGIYGSRVDHMQVQPDHPHIALLYNAFLADKIWVKLNPSATYVGQVADMSFRNFIDNEPNVAIDATAIEPQLEPEGITPDYIYMDAMIAEIADRRRGKKLGPLSAPIVNYQNGATPPPAAKDKSAAPKSP